MSLRHLKEYKEVIVGSKEYYNIIKGFKESDACSIGRVIPKINDWCKEICVNPPGQVCLYSANQPSSLSSTPLTTAIGASVTQSTRAIATTSLRSIGAFLLESGGFSNSTTPRAAFSSGGGALSSCYDEVFCRPRWAAPHLFVMLGLLGFVLCLLGILFNAISIPAYLLFFGASRGSNKHDTKKPENQRFLEKRGARKARQIQPVQLLLAALAFTDLSQLVMALFLEVIPALSFLSDLYSNRDHTAAAASLSFSSSTQQLHFLGQLDTYARFSIHLETVGRPLLENLDVLSRWLVIFLLLDRSVFVRFGPENYRRQFTPRRVALGLVVLVCGIGGFAVLKMFQFEMRPVHFKEIPASRGWQELRRGRHEELRKVAGGGVLSKKYYDNLIGHWIKVPLEFFFPLIFCVFLLSKVFAKVTENSNSNRAAMMQQQKADAIEKNQKETNYEATVEKQQEKAAGRGGSKVKEFEDAVTSAVLCVGVLSLLLQCLLHLVLHILRTESILPERGRRQNPILVWFSAVLSLLTLLQNFVRPLINLAFTRHFFGRIAASLGIINCSNKEK